MIADQLHLDGCGPAYDTALSQWPTDQGVARRLADWMPRLAQLRVLEPSAGAGNLVAAALEWGEQVGSAVSVDAMDIDPRWCAELRRRFEGKPVNVAEGDFMTTHAEGRAYDVAICNPPLDGGQGPVHVARALRFSGRVLSILTGGDMHTKAARKLLWDRHHLVRLAHLGRWKVGGSSRQDFVAVDVRPYGCAKVALTEQGMTAVSWWETA